MAKSRGKYGEDVFAAFRETARAVRYVQLYVHDHAFLGAGYRGFVVVSQGYKLATHLDHALLRHGKVELHELRHAVEFQLQAAVGIDLPSHGITWETGV